MAKHYTKLIIAINENINSIVTAVKGDVASRFLDVQLYSNGTPIDLTSHTVTMSAKSHPDSNFKVPIDKFIDGVITDATNGRCQFELKTDILGQTGVLILQISIFSGQQEVLSTNPFNLYVIDGLRNDEQIEASNEFGALVVLFSEIQNALDDMYAIRDNFGTPSEESLQAGMDTFWKVLEKAANSTIELSEYDLPKKLGNEFDGEPYNTLFGKMNRAISLLLKNGEQVFMEDGTFIVPDGVNYISIIAAGGGGGGASGDTRGAGGGGGGSCVKKETSVTPKQQIQITIGKGGAGGQAELENGKDGTATVVGNIVTCPGGHGGVQALTEGESALPGGAGGGKGGAGKTNGENGLYGTGGITRALGPYSSGVGGGGGSYGKGGDSGSAVGSRGQDGQYGGGGGSYNGVAGNGGNGIVIISWGSGSN